jgi:selenide,water dikinase
MAQASHVRLRFTFSQVPFVSCARKYAAQWTFPGGASDNRLYFGSHVHFAPSLGEMEQMMLFDPQTSGGLLLAVPPDQLNSFLARAREIDQAVWVIGDVLAGEDLEVAA